jgi:hypothetical protein
MCIVHWSLCYNRNVGQVRSGIGLLLLNIGDFLYAMTNLFKCPTAECRFRANSRYSVSAQQLHI